MVSINKIKTCTWVLASGQPCGAVKLWHWVRDDDDNRVKSYETFCVTHQKRLRERDE